MKARRLFVAGATGAIGRQLTRLARERGVPHVSHLRPGRDPAGFENPAVLALSDPDALDQALRGCTTVLQLIGSKRERFGRGDTYETSDVATTRQLVEAAKRVGVDHFVLLSSVGAGRPVGAYLNAKARAEALVMKGGAPYTIFRPSAFTGEGHPKLSAMKAVTGLLGLESLRPIPAEVLVEALLEAAVERAPLDAVVEGKTLWTLGQR